MKYADCADRLAEANDFFAPYQQAAQNAQQMQQNALNRHLVGGSGRSSLFDAFKDVRSEDVKIGSVLRIRLPGDVVADRLMAENRELRERITALEVQNAELVRQAMENMLAVDMPFVAATDAQSAPKAEPDRIWEELVKAALT